MSTEPEFNIKFDKNSNPFNDHYKKPLVAQFNVNTNNLKSITPRYENILLKVTRLRFTD
jgi:hypothetical protein